MELRAVHEERGSVMDQNCVFCRIIAGEIPATVVYEDEWTLAFEDLNPRMPVHVLVVPKVHYAHLGDEVPVEVLGHVFAAASQVARIKGIDESGYRVLSNIGKDACQSVFHLHVHVIGGKQMTTDI
jgi:histidine triad (HIT) family protein